MKIDKKIIKEVCDQHKVDHVVVTEDGHIFLPKAVAHAREHARQTSTKIQMISADGEVLASKEEPKTKAPNLNKVRPEPTLKQMNKAQLLKIVEDLIKTKKIDQPDTSLTNKKLVEWIEAAQKMDDAPKKDGSKKEDDSNDAPKEDAPKKDGSKKEDDSNDAPKEDAPKKEASKKEDDSNDAPKEDAPKKEASKKEDQTK